MDGGKVVGELKKQKGLWLAIGGLILVVLFYTYLDDRGGYFQDLDFMDDNNFYDITDGLDDRVADTAPRAGKYSEPPEFTIDTSKDYSAVIKTSYGNITVDLYEKSAPNTVNNFVFLANEDFYDGLTFHRVVEDFVIQGGDPLGTGVGGPGYAFDDEVSPTDRFTPYKLAMANAGLDSFGRGTNGSQFFITTKNSDTTHLSGSHTIFGEVTAGFSVVDEIEKVPTDATGRPKQEVKMQEIEIVVK